MVNKTKWMTLDQHPPRTHYRGHQDGFDISNTLSDSRKKDLIDWSQDTLLRQNINFSNSTVFMQQGCSTIQKQKNKKKKFASMN